MKCFILAILAGAVMLCGCTSVNTSPDQEANNYTPLGTMIPRKSPNRADNITTVDKQALENDRTMGGTNLDGRR
jgi:PBP1b-binding outer membrane lipoprotein LpoB